MKCLVVQRRSAGFFSDFNLIIAALTYLRENNITDFSFIWNNIYYSANSDENLFNKFFYNSEGFFDLKFNFSACNERYKLIINNLAYIKINDKELYKSFLLSLSDTCLCNSDELNKEIYNTFILESSVSSKKTIDKYDNLSNIIKNITNYSTNDLQKDKDTVTDTHRELMTQ